MANHLLNDSSVRINPATEEKQDDLIDATGEVASAGAIDAIEVGATTTVVLAAGATRNRVVLTNNGTERIDIAVGAAAVAGKGIGVPVAGVMVLTPQSGCRLAINGICASGGMSMGTQIFT